MLRILRIVLAGIAVTWLAPAWSVGLLFGVDDVSGPSFSARYIRAEMPVEMSRLTATIGELRLYNRSWRNVRLDCPALDVQPHELRCARATLQIGRKIPLSFRYDTADKTFDVRLDPAPQEHWQVRGGHARGTPYLALRVTNGAVARLAFLMPASLPRPSAGRVSGGLTWEAGKLDTDLQVQDLAFSDPSGLHAGEKVAGRVRLQARQAAARWQWQALLDWHQGEVFWQPLYFAKGGHQLQARGSVDGQSLRVEDATLKLDGIGAARLAGVWDRQAGRLTDFDLNGQDLDLAELFAVLLKPFLDKTALGQAQARGRGDLAWRFRHGETERFALHLRGAALTDGKQRFALQDIEANVPWTREQAAQAEIRIGGGSLYNLALGPMVIPLRMNGLVFDVERLEVPLLDGKLSIEDFHAEKGSDGWQWHFGGGLAPVSMQRFSRALGLTPMHGTLSAMIPRVSYAQEKLAVDGALLFKVFDGTAVVKDLTLLEPFGPAPRLAANIDMRRLNLDLLTRTFSFGNIQGLIDVEVRGLELSNWKPVSFDARVASSAGDYPRKISQTAVQNISALGGAGAAAAIQRSFLSFFEQFGYEKIGLSCRLHNGVCVMDGVGEAPQGYVIVQGGGIPAISVIGYNRHVSWQELLDRLARITQSNVKPIVQ